MEMKHWLTLLAMIAVFIRCHCDSDVDIFMEPKTGTSFVEAGGSVKYICTSKYHKERTLKWLLPTGVNQKSDLLNVENSITADSSNQPSTLDKLRAVLTIKKYAESMAGRYVCELNENGAFKNDFGVFLRTVKREGNRTVQFSRSEKVVTLSCKISIEDGKIEKPVWKRGDETITDKLKTDGSVLKADGEKLTIEGVMRSDAAMYTAVYNVTVKGEKSTYRCNVALEASPLVLDLDKSLNVYDGDNIELKSRVLGYPIPKVTWYKDNKPISAAIVDRISFEDNDGVPNGTIKINNVQDSDAGTYSCTGEFQGNKSTKSIILRVKSKTAPLWPLLGIVLEVLALFIIIFACERWKKRKMANEEDNVTAVEPEGDASNRSEGLRQRNTANNPRA